MWKWAMENPDLFTLIAIIAIIAACSAIKTFFRTVFAKTGEELEGIEVKVGQRGGRPMLTIGEYIRQRQPEMITALNHIWGPFPLDMDGDEYLTPYQRFLDKLMRRKPKPGRG